MKSVDTNILIYASDADCPEHKPAKALMDRALRERGEWLVADQVWFEFYKALRNPRIFRFPLSAPEAAHRVDELRGRTGLGHCHYLPVAFTEIMNKLSAQDFPYQRTHDAVLASSLRAAGVTVFYTRNVKDFPDAGFRVENPIDTAVAA